RRDGPHEEDAPHVDVRRDLGLEALRQERLAGAPLELLVLRLADDALLARRGTRHGAIWPRAPASGCAEQQQDGCGTQQSLPTPGAPSSHPFSSSPPRGDRKG